MMNLINSKFTQMRYNEVGFELSDWDKAIIIWNNYVVKDVEDGGDWGFYSLYEGALKQAVKVALEYDEKMEICKQLMDYIGAPVAEIRVKKNGEIIYKWSKELTFKEPLEECSSDRFENRFIKVPYVHCKGNPVKNVVTGKYGILKTSKEEWDDFISKVETNRLYVDYFDVAHTVYCLTEDGYWSHEHWDPMDMEVDVPEYDYSNKKERAMIRAFEAFSDYLSCHTCEATEKLVLSTTKDYAKACNEIRKAKKIEEYKRLKTLEENRDVYIYCFPMNQFIGSTPDWNDNKIYIDESPYLVDMDELI